MDAERLVITAGGGLMGGYIALKRSGVTTPGQVDIPTILQVLAGIVIGAAGTTIIAHAVNEYNPAEA